MRIPALQHREIRFSLDGVGTPRQAGLTEGY